MAPTSYLRRVQQIMHELVKDYQFNISIHLLNLRILGPVDLTNMRYRSRSESRIRAVLNREVRSRRITVDRKQNPMLITMTPDGEKFYRAFGSVPLYDEGDARLMRLTSQQLYRQAEVLKHVLEDIQHTFFEFYPGRADAKDLTTLPDAIKDFYDTLSELEHSNSELQLSLNYEEGISRRARQARGSAVRSAVQIA